MHSKLAAMLAVLPTILLGPALSAAAQVTVTEQVADPQVLDMGTLAGETTSEISALNDLGWAVGWSGPGTFTRATLWRDGTITDLGLGGREAPDGSVISSAATDVNEHGAIVANRSRTVPGQWPTASSAWVWKEGVATRLPATRSRPLALAFGVNDHGRAVGTIGRAIEFPPTERPVMWTKGQLTRLALPPHTTGGAIDINNDGLIVGYVMSAKHIWPWYWRVGGHHSGPLLNRTGKARALGGALAVNDDDLIVGYSRGMPAVWRGTDGVSRLIDSTYEDGGRASDVDQAGDVVGTMYYLGWAPAEAWVSHRGSSPNFLPSGNDPGADGTYAIGNAVMRGVTDFAPQGGVSVGGVAWQGTGYHATIWTNAYQQ